MINRWQPSHSSTWVELDRLQSHQTSPINRHVKRIKPHLLPFLLWISKDVVNHLILEQNKITHAVKLHWWLRAFWGFVFDEGCGEPTLLGILWQRAIWAAIMALIVRMAPALLPAAVPTRRWRTAGCGHSIRRGSKGRVERMRCYREEGGGSGGASSSPDGQQQQSGQWELFLLFLANS